MAKYLVIVESPAKSKTIQKYLGNDYIVQASFGHVRDLPIKEIGVDFNDNFKPKYVVSSKKVDIVKKLQNLAQKVDIVYLASDPDREGEAIAWHLNFLLKKHCSVIKRVEFNEITKTSVNEAISNAHEINVNLVNSQQARRILDRIVGYELSPWVSNVLRGKLSAGRVQSVSLRMIVDREREINNFKPEEYWKIYANLTPLTENFPFDAELFQKENNKISITDEQTAKNIVNEIKNKDFKVKEVIKKQKKRSPAPPFTTSTLQQEGSKKLRWDSSKTMEIAQQLYEGIELEDKEPHGLITYMRTDSTRINSDFQNKTLDFIKNKWGSKYSPNQPNTYKTKGDAQDAHEAIRPTDVLREPDAIKQYLSVDQYKLYKLIWERYVASQMESAVYDTLTVITEANPYLFKSTGSTIIFDGFMVLYLEEKDDSVEEQTEDGEKLLPNLSEKQDLKLLKLDPKQKFTSPPSRFTEASLIKELEKQGVGRPSTYASIISNIKDRQYIKVEKQKFLATELGIQIVDILVQYFPDIIEVKFTASMEDNLDTVAEGKTNWIKVLHDFYTPFSTTLIKAKSEVKPIAKEEILSDETCPNCQSQMAIKDGKFGKFLACTNYPDCKTVLPYIEEKDLTGINCEKCGKPMIIKSFKKNRKTIKFLACTGYPDCKNAKNVEIDKKGNIKIIEKPKAEITDKKCSSCGKPMALREGNNGKFYACTGYPDCKVTEPYINKDMKTIDCDKCGKPMLHRKGNNGYFYGCTGYPNCKNIKPSDKDGNIIERKEAEITDKKCPSCGKPMALREGSSGKFYACTGYPKCKTTLPFGETKPCPSCGKPMVKRKGSKGEFWGCTGYPTCKHLENI